MLKEDYPDIKSFAFITEPAFQAFRNLTGKNKSSYEVKEIMDREYKCILEIKDSDKIILKNGNTVVEDINKADHVYILSSIESNNDKSNLIFIFVKNRNQGYQPWEMQTVITENEYNNEYYTELGNRPKEMLKKFAFWQRYLEDLKDLKNNIALEENWSFVDAPEDDDFPILKSYMTYTFAKLWSEKQIGYGIDGRYCVFNTGLVNRNFQYIYAVFEKNTGDKPWRFDQFCIPGVRQGGRLLADNFKILPKPAHYFNDISDLSYIISTDKTPDEQLPDLQPDHYFIDHPDRLPLSFLIDGCRKNEILVNKLRTNVSSYTKEQKNKYWKEVGEFISQDADVYDDLESSFRNAVRKAVMRVSWNYRTAIPVYFPTYNKMSILLPLSFESKKSIAEVALVVERNPVSQRYSAPTILKLPMAYSNARLVCKPESDWLNQKVFSLSMIDTILVEDELEE